MVFVLVSVAHPVVITRSDACRLLLKILVIKIVLFIGVVHVVNKSCGGGEGC